MSDAILLRGGGEKPIHMWKKYDLVENVSYTWNRWNLVSTTVYKWEKWNAIGTTIYTWNKYNLENYIVKDLGEQYAFEDLNNWLWSSWVLSQTTGEFSGSGSSKRMSDGIMYGWYLIQDNPQYVDRIDSLGGNGLPSDGGNYTFNVTRYMSVKGNGIGEYVGVVSSTSSSAYPNGGSSGNYWYSYAGSSVEYSKGSTSYGQVTSTSSSAYPSNGASGSYWYVSAGSEVQYSKGSTQYSDVSSTSSSAYPDNGHDGSYWYDNKQTVINHSMGNYIEDVFSLAQDTYPANGIAGSYWYVYQGQI